MTWSDWKGLDENLLQYEAYCVYSAEELLWHGDKANGTILYSNKKIYIMKHNALWRWLSSLVLLFNK